MGLELQQRPGWNGHRYWSVEAVVRRFRNLRCSVLDHGGSRASGGSFPSELLGRSGREVGSLR